MVYLMLHHRATATAQGERGWGPRGVT
jgi:hypothetical protein